MEKCILFGASKLGNIAFKYLEDKFCISYFCDNDEDKIGKEVNGIRIISPKELINLKDTHEIIITSDYSNEIIAQLRKMGIDNFKVFECNLYKALEKHNIDRFANISYSQEGEDMLLKEIFWNKMNGFYVDIGAHHPRRFSNTCFFYEQKGWSGINIDPIDNMLEIFDTFRPKDINLQLGVSDYSGMGKYYKFSEPAINSISENNCVEDVDGFLGVDKIEVDRLDNILNKYVKHHIDFMSIDVEGLELQVLKSNDWTKYRPDIVLIEQLDFSFDELENDEILKFMKQNGYIILAKTLRTVFYQEKSFKWKL